VINWEDDNLGVFGGGDLQWPAAMVIDQNQKLYVSDEATHKICIFDTDGDGKFIESWGDYGDGEGQLNRPSGLAFDAQEDLYVSDTMNHRIQKFTKDGRFLQQWGRFGQSDGEFDMPWGLAVDELGDVYVADWRNDRVQKFTGDGEFIFKFGTSGQGDGEFDRPSGIAVDKDGDIYVVDWGNDRVQLFNSEGRYVEKFIGDANLSRSAREYVHANAVVLRYRDMSRLEIQRRFRGPITVTVDDQGYMYVPDFGSHRVQIYLKEAYPIEKHEITPPQRNPHLLTT
jgi:hypothetical protein